MRPIQFGDGWHSGEAPLAHGSNRTATEARKRSSPVPVTILSQRKTGCAQSRRVALAEPDLWPAMLAGGRVLSGRGSISLTAHCAPAAPASRTSRPLQFSAPQAGARKSVPPLAAWRPRSAVPDPSRATVRPPFVRKRKGDFDDNAQNQSHGWRSPQAAASTAGLA